MPRYKIQDSKTGLKYEFDFEKDPTESDIQDAISQASQLGQAKPKKSLYDAMYPNLTNIQETGKGKPFPALVSDIAGMPFRGLTAAVKTQFGGPPEDKDLYGKFKREFAKTGGAGGGILPIIEDIARSPSNAAMLIPGGKQVGTGLKLLGKKLLGGAIEGAGSGVLNQSQAMAKGEQPSLKSILSEILLSTAIPGGSAALKGISGRFAPKIMQNAYPVSKHIKKGIDYSAPLEAGLMPHPLTMGNYNEKLKGNIGEYFDNLMKQVEKTTDNKRKYVDFDKVATKTGDNIKNKLYAALDDIQKNVALDYGQSGANIGTLPEAMQLKRATGKEGGWSSYLDKYGELKAKVDTDKAAPSIAASEYYRALNEAIKDKIGKTGSARETYEKSNEAMTKMIPFSKALDDRIEKSKPLNLIDFKDLLYAMAGAAAGFRSKTMIPMVAAGIGVSKATKSPRAAAALHRYAKTPASTKYRSQAVRNLIYGNNEEEQE